MFSLRTGDHQTDSAHTRVCEVAVCDSFSPPLGPQPLLAEQGVWRNRSGEPCCPIMLTSVYNWLLGNMGPSSKGVPWFVMLWGRKEEPCSPTETSLQDRREASGAREEGPVLSGVSEARACSSLRGTGGH